jgi:ATP/maltotriose-dependent transcriptional regulator MalT
MARRTDVSAATAGRATPRRPASRPVEGQTGAFDVLPAQARVQVPRQRLAAELDRVPRHPLTLVVAPAGAGKTSGLAWWAASTRPKARWLVARPGDRPDVLAGALLAAAGVDPSTASGRPEETVRLLRTTTSQPRALVVDDAHHLPSASWALLDDVVTAAPDRLRMVLASRRDTPLPTVALELGDALVVLRSDVLKFDDGEAQLLVAAHAPDASEEDVQALQARADGWAAALVLGARSLAAAPDRAAARTALTHTEQPVLDYLLGEVFATMPAAQRHLLQCTADEPFVTAAEAGLMSGDPRAAEHLAALAAEGMLVTAFGSGAHQAWSYHPLLRELLRRQAAGSDRDLGVAAHARAAHHHALHGPPEAAARHAMLAGEHDLLADLLVERGLTLMTSGHEELVAEALRALPNGTADGRPALLGVTALLLRCTGEREQAVRVATMAARAADRVRASLAADGPPRHLTADEAALLVDAAILDAWLARLGWHDPGEAVAGAQAVRADLAAGGRAGLGEIDPARLAWLLRELAVMQTWLGEVETAGRMADDAVVTAQAVDNHRLVSAALGDRAVLQLLDGQFQTAAATARDSLAHARVARRADDGYLGRPHLALGWAAFYDLRLDEAAAELAEARRLEARSFDPLVACLVQVLEARLQAERGDVTGARRLLSARPAHPEPAPAFLDGIYAVVRAHWAVVDGDVSETEAQLPVMRALGWQVSTAVFEALLADLRGRPGDAAHLLDEALAARASGEQLVCAAFAAGCHARLDLAAGRVGAARAQMRDAMSRAAPQKLLHPLLAGMAAGGAYGELLRELAHGPDAHPFAGYVLAARERYRSPYLDVADRPDPAWRLRGSREAADGAPAPQALTRREAEVLRELALGGSYQDIAQMLFVTENTVKTHVSAVYRKLGVDRRADALRRARGLGLV